MSGSKTLRQELVPLIKLLASNNDNEVLAAVRGIKRKLAAAGRDLNDLALEVEKVPQRAVMPKGVTVIIRRG